MTTTSFFEEPCSERRIKRQRVVALFSLFFVKGSEAWISTKTATTTTRTTTITQPYGSQLLRPPSKRRESLCKLYSTENKSSIKEVAPKNSKKSKRYRPGSLMAATAESGRVPYGEESRKYRRTVFIYEDWVEHRTSERIFTNLKGIFFSGIVRQLRNELAIASGVAAFVVVWNSLSHDGVIPFPGLSLPSLPFTLSSPALGLLLVFRTNSSYARWSEARAVWSRVLTNSKNIVRMVATFTISTDDSMIERNESLERLAQASWLLSRSLMNSLSGPDDEAEYEKELYQTFSNNLELAERIQRSPNRVTTSWMELSLALDAVAVLDEKRRVEIDKSVILLGECCSVCDKIFSSPVPLIYTRHLARFLSLWMLLLPLAMYETFSYVEFEIPVIPLQGFTLIPAVTIVALFLFGIEELAMQLEEPFSILPMQKFCDEIKRDNQAMIEWSNEEAQRLARNR